MFHYRRFQNETEPESLCSEVLSSDMAWGLLNSSMPMGSHWGSQGFHRNVTAEPCSASTVPREKKNQTFKKPSIAWRYLHWNRKGAGMVGGPDGKNPVLS